MTVRPTKLTPELSSGILDALKGGVTRTAAIESVGINRSTLYRWLERGGRLNRGTFATFATLIKKAEAEAAIRNITIIQKAALGGEIEKITEIRPDGTIVVSERMIPRNWQAAVWWLERRYPNVWGRRARVDHRTPESR